MTAIVLAFRPALADVYRPSIEPINRPIDQRGRHAPPAQRGIEAIDADAQRIAYLELELAQAQYEIAMLTVTYDDAMEALEGRIAAAIAASRSAS